MERYNWCNCEQCQGLKGQEDWTQENWNWFLLRWGIARINSLRHLMTEDLFTGDYQKL